MKKFISTLAITLICMLAFAQQSALKPAAGKTIQSPAVNNAALEKKPMSVQVLVGTQGIGADYKYGFKPNLTGRLGFGIIPIEASNAFRFSGLPVQGDMSFQFANVHLLADYAPFKTQLFRVVAGAAYIMKGRTSALLTPEGNYNVGSRNITSDQFGNLHADVRWKGVAPYLGVSVLKNFPQRKFNVNFDIGTYYTGSPSTSFGGTKILSDNEAANASQFNQNMKGYHWLPVMQINFNYKIK